MRREGRLSAGGLVLQFDGGNKPHSPLSTMKMRSHSEHYRGATC